MHSLWNDSHRRELEERIARLTPTSAARWGKMKAPQMVAHLADAMRMAIGELHVPLRRTPFRHPPLKQLLVYLMPFPKGMPTARELQRAPTEWDREVADLRALLQRFAARERTARWPAHPAFGPLSARGWGVLQYRHCDHHLRQFGV